MAKRDELRELLRDDERREFRQRMHAALDRVLDWRKKRNCVGDREFLRRLGAQP